MGANELLAGFDTADLEREIRDRANAEKDAKAAVQAAARRRAAAVEADYLGGRDTLVFWSVYWRPWPDVDEEPMGSWTDERLARADCLRQWRAHLTDTGRTADYWDTSRTEFRDGALWCLSKRGLVESTGWHITSEQILGRKTLGEPPPDDRWAGPCAACGLPCHFNRIRFEYVHDLDPRTPHEISTVHPAWPELPEEDGDASHS